MGRAWLWALLGLALGLASAQDIVVTSSPATAVAGLIFRDHNNNQRFDPGEGLDGCTVALRTEDGKQVLKRTNTANGGRYLFRVDPGTYNVLIDTIPGVSFSPTVRRNKTLEVTEGYQFYNFFVRGGTTTAVQTGTIKGQIIRDQNANRQADNGEGVAGALVVVKDANGRPLANATTAPGGTYTFTLRAGTYDVWIESIPGITFPATARRNRQITIAAGQTVAYNFALGPSTSASLDGRVYDDVNGDGRYTANEGLPFVLVGLLDAAGKQLATAETGADGGFSLRTPGPGSYRVVALDGTADLLPADPKGVNVTVAANTQPPIVDLRFGDESAIGVASVNPGTTVPAEPPLPAPAPAPVPPAPAPSPPTPKPPAAPQPPPAAVGAVMGTVYQDRDGNRQAGAGEGLAGVQVQLVSVLGPVATAQTGLGGTYSLQPPSTGMYRVDVLPPAGMVVAWEADGHADGSVSVLATGPKQVPNIDFALAPPAITGSIVSATGQGQNDVMVKLLDPKGVALDVVTSQQDGAYSFKLPPAGSYRVMVVVPDGMQVASDPDGANDGFAAVTVAGSAVQVGAFGLQAAEPTGITGTIFQDANGNGRADAGEGLKDVMVKLLDPKGVALDVATSQQDGAYAFKLPPAGSYRVMVVVPDGMQVASDPDGAKDGFGSVTVGKNSLPPLDFGLSRAPQFITGSIVSATGQGLKDVMVKLLDPKGVALDVVTSQQDGAYAFKLPPAGSYRVMVVVPDGMQVASDPDGAKDGFASVTVGTASVKVGPFGLAPPAPPPAPAAPTGITGTIFQDANGNGRADAGEGLKDVMVKLLDTKGVALDVVTSQQDGAYAFKLPPAGSYRVMVVVPDGMQVASDPDFLLDGFGSVTVVPNRTPPRLVFGLRRAVVLGGKITNTAGQGVKDVMVKLLDYRNVALDVVTSQADGSYAFKLPLPGSYRIMLVVPEGMQVASDPDGENTGFASISLDGSAPAPANFMLRLANEPIPAPSTSIAGSVVLEGTGQGLKDVMVKLLDLKGVALDVVTSQQDGAYAFKLPPTGSYRVMVVVPDGMQVTSDPDGAKDGFGSVTVGAATRLPTLRFTLRRTAPTPAPAPAGAAIGGQILVAGMDKGIEGVLVKLLDGKGATVDMANSLADGSYSLNPQPPGTYQLMVVVPATMAPATDPDGGSADGLAPVAVLPGRPVGPFDFSLAPAKAALPVPGVTGTVYVDKDSNFELSDGEGLAGISVALYGASGAKVGATTSSDDGSYSFGPLQPGTYRVVVEPDNNDMILAADPTDELSGEVTLKVAPGTTIENQDFGFLPFELQETQIKGRLYLDRNANGRYDPGEGLANVRVFVMDAAHRMKDKVPTDADGKYTLKPIVGGDFEIYFKGSDLAPGITVAKNRVGEASGVNKVKVAMGQEATGYDFIFRQE